MARATPTQRKIRGLPEQSGTQITLPPPQGATEASLMRALPQPPPEVAVTRTIEASFCTHNIGAVPDFSKKSRITDLVGKLQLLAGRYKARNLHLVGIQEARSRKGGQHQVGDFLRIVPNTEGPAQGDVELWINTSLAWDPEDPGTKVSHQDVQIFATGPRYVCVSIRNNWLALDVVVAHAPHTWGTKEQNAPDAHKKIWSHLRRSLAKRHRATPVLMLMDANLEVGESELALIGSHQAATKSDESTHLEELLTRFDCGLPQTYEHTHKGARHTHQSSIQGAKRRIDYVAIL